MQQILGSLAPGLALRIKKVRGLLHISRLLDREVSTDLDLDVSSNIVLQICHKISCVSTWKT